MARFFVKMFIGSYSQKILGILFPVVYIRMKLLCTMAQHFVEPNFSTETVVNNPSIKMDNSVEGNFLRIAQILK